MELTFTEAAQAKLSPKVMDTTVLVLDFDDGVGPFSDAASCTLDVSFSMVLANADQVTADFNEEIDSNLGAVKVKGYSKDQLDNNIKLDVNKNMQYVLTGDSGIIDSNVKFMNVQ